MTAEGSIPVIERSMEGIFAVRDSQTITVGQFLADVHRLADQLLPAEVTLNLVRDRYHFTVAFVAAAVRGQTTLLPPNPKPAVQSRLMRQHSSATVIHDGIELAPGLPGTRIDPRPAAHGTPSVPAVAAHRVAAISYTSGSTGDSSPIPKTWNMFRRAVRLYRATFMREQRGVVATVPAQHMYGLELSALLPLWADATMTCGKPLFPVEVLTELRGAPEPRLLVTTPLHLRTLLESGLRFPGLSRILCATAPLSAELARRAESVLGAEVIDVYGCSEAGCMATRRLAKDERWQALPGFDFDSDDDGVTTVNGAHMDTPVILQDRLRFCADDRFRLAGRDGDLVNVAGKRGSLNEITQLLMRVPGVTDAHVFMPDTGRDDQRLAALYTGAPPPREVREALGRHIDSALVPRPLIRLDELPRSDTSKLPREHVLAVFHAHQARNGR